MRKRDKRGRFVSAKKPVDREYDAGMRRLYGERRKTRPRDARGRFVSEQPTVDKILRDTAAAAERGPDEYDAAFTGSPIRLEYRYRGGYRDLSFTYGYPPGVGDDLRAAPLRGVRAWITTKIEFAVDPIDVERVVRGQHSRYTLNADMNATAFTKPTIDPREAFSHYSEVISDIGIGRVVSVEFRLYEGAGFPAHQYPFDAE